MNNTVILPHQRPLQALLKSMYTITDNILIHNKSGKVYKHDRDGIIEGVIHDQPLRFSFIQTLMGDN